MRATVIILFVCIAQSFAIDTYSQNARISLKMDDVSVEKVLEAIEHQSEFFFMYESNKIDVQRTVSVSAQDELVSKVLDDIFKNSNVSYKITNRQIALTDEIPGIASQQQKTVTGKVNDSSGLSLPGVSVVVKGTTIGTITDGNGLYTLANIPDNAILQFSFVGMKTSEVVVGNKTKLNITLAEETIGLEEVIAIGYEVRKKSLVSGAISSLNATELQKAKTANVVNALNGRVAGVTVMQSSGQPGSVPKLVIRGVGTNGNSNPLYLIDGLPMDDMNGLNPNDIESMEVLKDATSTAIYGARGANGVVLISTKKGKNGVSSITYDGYYGVSSAQSQTKMLNTDQYLELMKEFYSNDKTTYPSTMPSINNGIDTNWMDVVFNTAPVTEHNITATLGSDKGTTLLSLGYWDQNGIMGGDKSFFKRYSARMNNVYELNKFFRIGANLNFNYIDKNGVSTGSNGWNPLQYAYMMDPTTPAYDPNSTDSFGYGVSSATFGRMWNPLSFMKISSNGYNRTNNFYGNAYAEIIPIKDLVIRTDFGTNLKTNRTNSYSPKYYHNSSNFSETSSVSQSENSNSFWQWENTIRYKKSFQKNNLSILLGTTASENTSDWFSAGRKNLPDEAFDNPNYWFVDGGDVATSTNTGSESVRHTLFSMFGRLSYNYAERYMLDLVTRRDGSSNFGPNKKYGVFPGFSIGWNASNEEFWKVKNFDSLKLRLSRGQNGNENITPFSYTSIIGYSGYSYTLGQNATIYTGAAPNSLVNPDVKWETSEQLNIGADMVFFGGKVKGSIDYYKKNTKDLLFRPTLEAVRGNIAAYQNIGEISNSGFDLQAGYNTSIGKVDINVSANLSYLKNNVVKVGNTNGYVEGGLWRATTNITRMEEGHPMGYFYGYKTLGIFQTAAEVQAYKNKDGKVIQPSAVPGDFIWQDTNQDGTISGTDRIDLGNPWPKWNYGVNLSAQYRGFDFNMFLNGKADYKIYTAQYRTEGYGRSNLPELYMDRWTKAGDNNGVPRLSMLDPNQNFGKASDFYLYSGSFLKIGSIEIGYKLPATLIKNYNITNLRFYVAMDNVATFTNYPYLDPEVGAMEGDILNTGLDYSLYPQARTVRMGVSLSF